MGTVTGFCLFQSEHLLIPRKMWLLKGVVIIVLLNQVLSDDSLPDEINKAIDFCGSLGKLTDGECPPQGPGKKVERKFLPARNVKVFSRKDIPSIPKNLRKRSWKNTKITNFKFNAYFNETNGRYGFGNDTSGDKPVAKPYLIQIDFEAPQDIIAMAGRGVGRLVQLARVESFEKDLCNEFLANPCKGKGRCPTAKGEKVRYIAKFPFTGNYYRGLETDLRIELYAADTIQDKCVNQDSIVDDNGNLTFGEPIVCLILQGYIL